MAGRPSASARGLLAETGREELPRVRHPDRRPVGAGDHAARLLVRSQVLAEIADGRFLAHDGLATAGALVVVHRDPESVHVDVAVRAVLGTDTAPDAPVLDLDLERVATADRAHRAADHAEGVAALAARRRHEVVLEAQPLAHEARDAVVRRGAGLHAQVAARAAVEVEEEEALGLHQALTQEVLEVDVGGVRLDLDVLPRATLGLGEQVLGDLGEALEHQPEVIGRDPHDLDVVNRRAGGAPRRVLDEAHLAEVAAASLVCTYEVSARTVLRDLHEPEPHDEETVGRLALTADDLAGFVAGELDALAEVLDELLAEAGEERHAAEVRVERAAAVGLLELGTERLGAQQYLQRRAQHLEDHTVLSGAHGCGPRIEVEAGHLAEELARVELRHGSVAAQVDRRVDRDERRRPDHFQVFAADEPALHLEEEAGQPARIVPHARERCRDRNLTAPFDDVERRRAEVTLAADDLAGAERAADDRPLVAPDAAGGERLRQELGRDAVEERGLPVLTREPHEHLDRHRLSLGEARLAEALVHERAGRAGGHALAAGDARRLPHRGAGVEGDHSRVALAGATDHDVVRDVRAGAHAAVADDAGRMVDGDVRVRVV